MTSPAVPPLKVSISKVVEFPEEDESIGEFSVTCFGPDANDIETNMALDILGEYLSDSAVSVLSQTFIEIEDPMSTRIVHNTSTQLPCTLSLHFDSVPVEHLDAIEPKLFEVLQTVVDKGFDMERMAIVIERERNRCILSAERSPSEFWSLRLTYEVLYGSLDGRTLRESASDLQYYDIVSKWTSEQWAALLKR